ncbi:MAG TPA: ATP-dependent DNA helicase RecG [Steroidobacteraceae bacterium]|nr:ATP-dependent DNA helicase RecG [Steroidobacteraceae bacterium]
MNEHRPVAELRGVGPALAEKLAKLGVTQVQDLLFVLPARYEDRTQISAIGELRAGTRAVVEGEILLTEVAYRRRRQLLCRITDGTASLTLRFFYFSGAQQANLARGARIRCFGEVRKGPLGLEIVHPEYRRIGGVGLAEAPLEEVLTPIYPTTEGVPQVRLRALIDLALKALVDGTESRDQGLGVRDWIPPAMLADLELPSLADALTMMHRPPRDAHLPELLSGHHPAQRRLSFEELLAHQLSLRLLRQEIKADPAAPLTDKSLEQRFLRSLPFSLTGAQSRALADVDRDLAADRPMVRLVQGDVGCGKTVVAAAAAARAVGSGLQAALMAPTELLAEQHAKNFERWFRELDVPVALVTGSLPARARRNALAAVANGSINIVVGTHALFQESMEFARLGLVIVDEQHRFGVHQRLSLRDKGARDGQLPHQLIMTATPIPRTLAMTAYADLDVSVIDELPPGRTPVKTVVLPETRRDEIVERIHKAVLEGRQAYWVCPLIDESEELRYQAAEETATALQDALPEVRVGLVHGRMSTREKELGMYQFKEGTIGLLVATTVIEVGVDVPNATLMVIENAERMGLAQLHQLRGRVGRGSHESHCVLLYGGKLSEMARARLAAIRETNDGFVIARRDLELRGPGELLGTRQTGLADMRVADLIRDADLLPSVQGAAEVLLRENPDAVRALTRRWIGAGERYGRIG